MRTPCSLALAATTFASLGTITACSSSDKHLDVTVTWSDTKQTIDGFGASSAFFASYLTDDQADQLFDAKKGLGLSLLRTMIGVPEDTQSDGSEPTEGANPVATAPELFTAKQAAARGTHIWAAAWTPPPIWKTTNSKKGSDSAAGFTSNTLMPEHYQDFADYLADFVDLMTENEVPLVGVSPVNEPDYTAGWDNSQMSPDQLTKFIAENMGPTFATRAPSVKLIAPETANFPNCETYVNALLADPAAAGYVPVVATHPYPTSGSPNLAFHAAQDAGKAFWQSEWSQENLMGDTPDPSMTSAIDMMKHMHDHLVTTEVSAWNWWAVFINGDGLNDDNRLNPAFIQPDATKGLPVMFKRGYAFGNWSKFVRPGFQRIGATDTPAANVLIEAYRDATHLAIVAINAGTKAVSQKFILDGGSIGSLTPWVTSEDDSLAAKDAIDASSGTFTYDLPPTSVVTLVSWDATTETPGLILPTGGTPTPPRNGLDCANAIVPTNGGEGGVTDFTDWNTATTNWGSPDGLFGSVYSYHGSKGSTMSATVDHTTNSLHITGGVTAGDYAGAGLGFLGCVTAASFTQMQFTVSGVSEGCDLELQIKTFDQTPTSQNPPGGCDKNAGSCYSYPSARKVAVPAADAATVITPLTGFSGWSAKLAGQVVGLQWQFTGTAVDASNATGCPIDVSITGIKFLP